MNNTPTDIPADISQVIEMAWCDKTSFDQIEKETGKSEKDVIKLMRRHLKAGSFRVWRERVSGRKMKHAAKRVTRPLAPARDSDTQAEGY